MCLAVSKLCDTAILCFCLIFFLLKVIREGNDQTRGMDYLELKQIVLLTYCQAICFYLLLKSEGHPVRDHPVISRLVEIKNLWEKVSSIIHVILQKSQGPVRAYLVSFVFIRLL